jgi:hypothetical protein
MVIEHQIKALQVLAGLTVHEYHQSPFFPFFNKNE